VGGSGAGTVCLVWPIEAHPGTRHRHTNRRGFLWRWL